ncbi:MAG: hypothetical protein QNK24_11625 [Desulfuromusa sp.]|nr:hypothetical protein [Desulfuromusa sp.]
MKKQPTIPHTSNSIEPTIFLTPNITKPIWVDQQMNCSQCKYNDQDIDTFPCAKCHTRD